jgi:hypothetical protein
MIDLFLGYIIATHRSISEYFVHIFFYVVPLSFEDLILDADPLEARLEEYIHHIEKERNIEYRISHREDLACCCIWYEITKSYRRCRDDSEVESIEVALSDGMSCFEIMNQKCANSPARDEYDTYCDEFLVMDMDHSDIFMV